MIPPSSTAFLAVTLLAVGLAFAAETPIGDRTHHFLPVDLQSKANQKLADALHGFTGNDLSELPIGFFEAGGVRFKVDAGYIRLSGKIETSSDPKKPAGIAGLAIEQTFHKIHFLHGTGYGAFGQPGGALFIADGTKIGEYILTYEDGSTESLPIIYGEDVRDWWNWEKPAEVSRGQIAWRGENAFSRKEKQHIYLYLGTWSNPHPEKKVASLAYLCAPGGTASPFCIAITLEE